MLVCVCIVGESLQPDGMLALMKWEEETPYVYFFKHGLDEEKVVSIDCLMFLTVSACLIVAPVCVAIVHADIHSRSSTYALPHMGSRSVRIGPTLEVGRYTENIDISFRYRHIVSYRPLQYRKFRYITFFNISIQNWQKSL